MLVQIIDYKTHKPKTLAHFITCDAKLTQINVHMLHALQTTHILEAMKKPAQWRAYVHRQICQAGLLRAFQLSERCGAISAVAFARAAGVQASMKATT